MRDTIVLYPAPGSGHVVSMVELGKLILHRHPHKFTINILITSGSFLDSPSTTSYLRRISQTNPSITFHIFPPVSVDTSPTRSPAAMAFDFICLNAPNVRRSLQQISQTSTARAFIIDFFCTSALPIAVDELGIPTYYFFTSGMAALAAYLYFPIIHKQHHHQSFKDLTTTDLNFPGLPPLRATHMPEPVLNCKDPAYDYMLYFSMHLTKSNGIIVNTFEELEPIAVEAVRGGACVPDSTTPPIYCIGPLIAAETSTTTTSSISNEEEEEDRHECLKWLDKQPRRSVVFLCFGSRGTFPAEQLKEIANGLERSRHRFLWVVRKPAPPASAIEKEEEGTLVMLDQGFLERTKERGLVVESWAPQVAILSHESVGGFVTHCGWNSVLEAVVAGVPMVAWPLYAEQHLNKAALVEDMKMAIPVTTSLKREDDDGFLVSGEEVEISVRELMMSAVSEKIKVAAGRRQVLRERSMKMREMALNALGELGSSTTALANLVHLWSA